MRRRVFKLALLLLFAALMAALGTPAVVEAPEARQPAAGQDVRRDDIDTLVRLANQEQLFRAWLAAEEPATGTYGTTTLWGERGVTSASDYRYGEHLTSRCRG